MPPSRRLAERKQAREDSRRSCEFDFVLRLQSYLVHFANDALTEVEITARHGRVWILKALIAAFSKPTKIVRRVARGT